MKRLLYIIIGVTALLTACGYDESVDTLTVTVQLVYPEGSTGAYEGARVELKDATSSIFVDSTDAQGIARFTVPPGIYEASSTDTHLDDHPDESYAWRYNYNGLRSHIVVSPDSLNRVALPLTMSRRRILY